MDPRAIIAALPWLRRIWRVLPPPLRVPLLLVAAAIGIVQFVQGRKAERSGGTGASAGASSGDSSLFGSG